MCCSALLTLYSTQRSKEAGVQLARLVPAQDVEWCVSQAPATDMVCSTATFGGQPAAACLLLHKVTRWLQFAVTVRPSPSMLKQLHGPGRSALACLLVPGLLLFGQEPQHEVQRVIRLLQQQLRHQVVPERAQVVSAGIGLKLQHLSSKICLAPARVAAGANGVQCSSARGLPGASMGWLRRP